MSNVTLSWTLKTPSPRQRAIKHTAIDIRVKATPPLPWTNQDIVNPTSEQRLVLFDVAPGTYEAQAIVFDAANTPSAPAVVEYTVGFDAPDSVQNLAAVVA